MIAALSACRGNSGGRLSYEVTYFDYNEVPNISVRSDVPERIDSLEQLTAFCSEAEIRINDKDSLDYDGTLYKKLRSYDKEFFKNKSLILLSKAHGAGYWNYEFGNLKIKDDNLIISILNNNCESDYEGYDMPDVYTQYLWIIEINKDSIKDVNQITVQNYGIIK